MCNRTTAVLICGKIVYNVKKMMKRVCVCECGESK